MELGNERDAMFERIFCAVTINFAVYFPTSNIDFHVGGQCRFLHNPGWSVLMMNTP